MNDTYARRSWFLVFVVFLANAYLVTFGAEALVSLLNDVTSRAPNAALLDLGSSLGVLTLLLWLLMIFALIFVPHLPKSVLLPPVLVMAWQMIGAPPLKWSMTDRATWLPIDAIALGSVALAFLGSKIAFDSWFLRASRLPYKENLVSRTLIALPVALFVVVIGIAGLLVVGVKTFAEQGTAGYLRFGADAIEVQEAVLRKDDREVHLVGVVHFAEPSFYRDLYASIPAGAVILAEGVSDREGKMKTGLSYNNVAGTIGLQSQDVFEEMLGPPEAPVPTAPQPVGKDAKKTVQPLVPEPPAPAKPKVIRADIDIADLSPVTLRFLDTVGDVYASKSFDEVLRKLTKVGDAFTDADIKVVMNDIVAKRNERVLSEFDKQIPNYKVIFIPWGAQHMPALEKGMLDRGFKVESRRMLPLARYQTIFDALQKRGRPAEVSPVPRG